MEKLKVGRARIYFFSLRVHNSQVYLANIEVSQLFIFYYFEHLDGKYQQHGIFSIIPNRCDIIATTRSDMGGTLDGRLT